MTVAVRSALAGPIRPAATHLVAGVYRRCVCKLMRRLGATQSRMSRHIQVLKQVGLVVDRSDAQCVRDKIRPDLPPFLCALMATTLVPEVMA